jgi:hypothetical protein
MAKKAQLPKSPPAGTKPSARAARSSNSRYIVLALIAGVLILALGVILLQVRSNRQPVEVAGRVGEGTSWGPADAPVVIEDYSDFG